MKQSCRPVKIRQQLTSAISRLRFAGEYLSTNPLLISISNSAVIYRLNPPQAACTASANETHWFGCDLKRPDSCAMWKRTYGSLSPSPTFLSNLDRTLSVLSPPRTRRRGCGGIQLLVPSGISILSVLWKNRKRPLAHCYCEVMFCNFSLIIVGGSLSCSLQWIWSNLNSGNSGVLFCQNTASLLHWTSLPLFNSSDDIE